MDKGKASDRRQADKAKVTMAIKKTEQVTHAWLRLFTLLLRDRAPSTKKEDSEETQND